MTDNLSYQEQIAKKEAKEAELALIGGLDNRLKAIEKQLSNLLEKQKGNNNYANVFRWFIWGSLALNTILMNVLY
ncbi:MAG: hypothetical protein JJV89_03355 [Desulfosarcina sp.]|nr:hypothetical protein [Desulfobacterales bacterium]